MSHDDPTPQFVEAITKGRVRGLLVPTGILISIGMASAAGVWSGAKFFYGNLETRIVIVETHQGEADKRISAQAEDIAVLKANAANTTDRLNEVNRKLDTVIDLLLHRSDKP